MLSTYACEFALTGALEISSFSALFAGKIGQPYSYGPVLVSCFACAAGATASAATSASAAIGDALGSFHMNTTVHDRPALTHRAGRILGPTPPAARRRGSRCRRRRSSSAPAASAASPP